ncbi:MAG: hypothetical protein BWX47_01419 [candidate division Hyd24-12 bacterium ADurb.Bin004]|nr:MAG: hypothetical protein BWX47_01419 [candidate division Hyd24-12 bacterium ADurb.Bin004]
MVPGLLRQEEEGDCGAVPDRLVHVGHMALDDPQDVSGVDCYLVVGRAGVARHRPLVDGLVETLLVYPEGEAVEFGGRAQMPRKPEHRAAVQASAEGDPHRNVRDQIPPDGVPKSLEKPFHGLVLGHVVPRIEPDLVVRPDGGRSLNAGDGLDEVRSVQLRDALEGGQRPGDVGQGEVMVHGLEARGRPEARYAVECLYLGCEIEPVADRSVEQGPRAEEVPYDPDPSDPAVVDAQCEHPGKLAEHRDTHVLIQTEHRLHVGAGSEGVLLPEGEFSLQFPEVGDLPVAAEPHRSVLVRHGQ